MQNRGILEKNKKQSEANIYVKKMWRIYGVILAIIVVFFVCLSAGWLGFMPSFEQLIKKINIGYHGDG